MDLRISIEMQWPMGHRLQDHDGACRGIHGHTYRAVAQFSGLPEVRAGSPQRGMVADFAELKKAMAAVVDGWDHCLMLEDGDPAAQRVTEYCKLVTVDRPPTAEVIAEMLFAHLRKAFPYGVVVLESVQVWESPRTSAEVRR